MNILDRLNTIIEKEALGDVRNTVVDISPEAFGLLISQHADEIRVSEGIRARQAQPVDVNRPQFAGGSKVSMDGAYGKK
jgi:hypothetical protein